MLADGLYTRFPKPDFAVALHTVSNLPAGVIGYGAYAGSYCAQLYNYDYYRWLYECQ